MNFDENLADFGCGLEEEGSMTPNAAAFLKSYARTTTVFNAVNAAEGEESKREIIRNYLDFCYECQERGVLKRAKNVVSFSLQRPGFESITSSSPPDLGEDSVSTLYLIEFFTHCCINCIHSIEDVRQVHEQIEKLESSLKDSGNGFRGMKVLSVHSPKFPREKDTASIKAFCKRNRMDHSDVVNDPDCILWNEFGVTCWPTLLVLGPNPDGRGPNLLFNFMGEGHKTDLLLTLTTAIEYFAKNLKVDPSLPKRNIEVSNLRNESANESGMVSNSSSFLKFPGKVVSYEDLLVISDSGNNRLVLARSTGEVMDVIGSGVRGYQDGNFETAQFYNPQGVAFESDSLFYVADTGNHSVRKVDLNSKAVSTLVSPGCEVLVGEEKESLKSPWDLAFYDPDILIVAAAGNHRLFGYFLNDATLFSVDHKEGSFAVIAGSGREENRNNSYIMKASFAQPSGITAFIGSNNENMIYIADSESSSIRGITSKGQVVGVVGGSRDPTDLFAFGDIDGKGYNVKLQHPMGVCPGATPTEIYIADTYNHKIKKIDLISKECLTVVSSGLNEPSGISKGPERDILYVADTNNHSVKVVNIQTGKMSDMELIVPESLIAKPAGSEKCDKHFQLAFDEGLASLKLNFELSPLPENFEGGQWKVLSGGSANLGATKGSLAKIDDMNKAHFTLTMENMNSAVELLVNVDIYFCGPNSCLRRTRKIRVSCDVESGASQDAEKTLEWVDMAWDN